MQAEAAHSRCRRSDRDGAEETAFLPIDTRCEVQGVGIAQRGDLPAVLPEEYLPQAGVSDRRARAGVQRADQRKRLRIEGVDHAVSEVADQKVATEAAKACRGKRHPPGCIQHALTGDSRHEVSIVVELIDIAETRTYALKCGGADLGVSYIDVSANTMDAKRRIARWQCRIGKATRKSVRSEGAVEDIHGTLLKVSRKQERSGRIGVERDVGVRGLGRIIDHRNRLRPAAHIPGGNRTIERAEEEQSRCAAWNIEDSGVAVVYRAAWTAVRRRGSGRRYRNGGQRRYRNSAGGGIDRHRATASLIDPDGRPYRNAPGVDERGIGYECLRRRTIRNNVCLHIRAAGLRQGPDRESTGEGADYKDVKPVFALYWIEAR